jgi:hypothetical protein
MQSFVTAALASFSGSTSGKGGRNSEARTAAAALPKKLFVGFLFLFLGFMAGCGGSSSPAGPLAVSISPPSAIVSLGGTQSFIATVANDSSNKGVTWTLTENGVACSPTCGTISSSSTASGASLTYTAPGATVSATLTATSVTDTSRSAVASINVTGSTTVSVSPSTVQIGLSATQQFYATVSNDSSNKGVNWTLSQGGNSCLPGCGTLSATTSANGVAITYTAPASAPTNSANVTLTAASIAFPGQTGWATITIQGGLTVSVSPTYVANVPVNGTHQFIATVTNDTSNAGVTWALSQNGNPCSSDCGSVSPASTASGTATTYTAPATGTTVTLTATSVTDTTISNFATIIVEPISVTVSPTSANIYPAQTLAFTAFVSNDIAQGGVTWSLLQNGTSCSPTCGSFSQTTTASGVSTTYTAPSSISSAATVSVVATSVTDKTRSASATLHLYPPISVAVSPTTASVAVNGRTTFTATVTNDPTNAGVGWTLTQNDKACSPTCGLVSPTDTTSGISTTYFAPSTVPSPSTVTLTAQSLLDVNQSASATITVGASSAAARLSGSYAFQFNGYDTGGAVAMAGSFTMDAAGNITGGMLDVNRASGVAVALPLTGSYTIGPDGSGSFTLTSSAEGTPLGTFRFALNAAGDGAQFAEFDDSETRGSGVLQRQTLATFSPATLTGDYAFGVSGAGPQGSRLAVAGRFHADGAGKITGGVLDSNLGGSLSTEVSFTGAYTVSSSGRGTLAAATPQGTLRWAFYAVSPGKVFLISTDPRSAGAGSSGEALVQSSTQGGTFSAASLRGTSVIRFAGISSGREASKVGAGLVTFDGRGGLEYTIDENDGGKPRTLSGEGSYSVAPDGRVTMTLGTPGNSLVSYLVDRNQALLIGAGADVSSGSLDAQAAGRFTNSSLTGNYALRTVAAPSSSSAFEWGMVKSAGLGQLDGTEGSVSPKGLRLPEGTFSETYAVSPSGRAAMGSGGVVLYFISPSRAVLLDMRAGVTNATIVEIQK